MGFLMGRWGRALQRYYIPLFLLTSNFLSSTEIVPSEMEYQVTSSLIYYNKNSKISPMLISVKPLIFLLRCLSDSLSTSRPFDFTGTQKELTVINLFYEMAVFSTSETAQARKKPKPSAISEIYLVFCLCKT